MWDRGAERGNDQGKDFKGVNERKLVAFLLALEAYLGPLNAK